MNNRQLKFRVWDKLEKRFIYPDKGYQGHYVLDLNGRFQNLQNGSGGDEYVVQQFTGLYALDGKEIWEGDLVMSIFEELTEAYFDSERGSYRLKTRSDTTYQIISPTLNEKDVLKNVNTAKTVVGNIFQLPCNPDHNGECLVCDESLDGCPFIKNEDDKVIEIMGQKFNQHWAEQLLDVCKTASVISDEQISLDLPEKYKPEFEEFMRGKTCPILDNGQRGVYSWDFEQYLKTVLRNIKK